MPQHFLLTSAARTLSLASVMRMSDSEAEQDLRQTPVVRQRRERVLSALRLPDRLFLPPPERRAALAVQSLPERLLSDERDALRPSQVAP
jgi:hypothetical protein